RDIVAYADEHRLGLLRVLPPGAGAGVSTPVIELWRTAALSRARRTPGADRSAPEAGESLWGARWVNGAEVGLSAPATTAGARTRSGGTAAGVAVVRPREPAPVPVAGVRSLVRATGLVARLAVGKARQRLHRGPFAPTGAG